MLGGGLQSKVTGRAGACARHILLLAILLLGQVALAAAAQATDWVVNINDTGYDPTGVNGTVVYTITVGNEDLATNTSPATTLQLTIPGNGTFTGATGTISGCTPTPLVGPGVVTCNVPPIVGGQDVQLLASVKATATPDMTIDVSVPTAGDADPSNNIASEKTTITSSADMELSLSAPASEAAGSLASYVFTARNLGPDSATGVKVMVPAPDGLVEVTFPGCTLVGTNYECFIPGPLAANASQTFTLSGVISAASGSTVTLSGSVGGGSPVDPVPGNNLVTASTSVTEGSDVRIAKSRSPTAVKVGDPVTFTLAASYVGDSPTGLVIEDVIPATYDRTSVVVTPSPGSGWNCSYSNPTVTCTLASGSGSGAVSLGSITIETTAITATGGGGVSDSRNTATISSSGPLDPNLANNTADDGGAIIEEPTSDLSANKSGPNPPLVVVGQSYDFSISSKNNGNKPFSGTLTMTDALPAGLEVTSYALNGWSCSPATPVTGAATIACTRVYDVSSPLAVGATTPAVTLTALVTSSAAPINNCMAVSSTGAAYPDTNPGNDQACYNITPSLPGSAADLSVIKTRSLASLASGDIQTFTIEVVNSGPVTSTNISVEDTLNSLTSSSGAVSVTSIANNLATPFGCSTSAVGGNATKLSCSIGSLPVCTAGTDCPVITVEARQGGNAGPRSNTATAISSSVADPDLANNTSTVNYDITAQADVTVGKTANATSPAGQDLIYVITARTTGDGRSQAENVTIDDTLPNDLIFISATPSAGACSTTPTANSETTSGNNQVLCNLGTIGNNGQQTVTIRVRPKTVTAGTSIQNNVAVSTSTPGDDPANNSASTTTSITNPTLDLLVNKTDSPDPTAVGENTVYTITITNSGPSAAENVTMTDALPGAPNTTTNLLKFISYTPPPGGTCGTVPAVNSTGGTLQCSVAYLAAGQSKTITVTMEGIAKGVTRNTATVASDETAAGFDTNLNNNTVVQDTTVRTRVDVEVTSKIPSKTPVALREPFTFAITVRNNTGGNLAEADNTTVTDNLPANMVLTGQPTAVVTVGTTTANSCSGAAGASSFVCAFGTMSSGGQLVITMPVMIVGVSALPQTFTNTASVSTSSLESNTSNNSNSGQVSVEQAASLAGKVFRDFNDNGIQDLPGDTPISGVVMTLSGETLDGTLVTLTATTEADGSYLFPIIPAGVYTVTRGDVSEAGLENGKVTAGTAGGIPSTLDVSGIKLTDTTAATGYDFALVPTAAMTVGKSLLSDPVNNPDGTFDATFRVTVTVNNLEDVDNVTVNDQLAGPAPLFGTYMAVPSTPGTYSISAPPSGTCGGLNAGFDGSASVALASGFTLPPSGSCYIDFTVRTLASVPLPPFANGGHYINQASASGTGRLSGQTPSNTSPQVPVSVDIPQLILDKVLTANSDPDSTGTVTLDDVLTYTLTATNSGSVTLTDVVVSDDKISPNSITCPSVAPGETCVLTGTLVVTLADVQAKKIVNNGTADSDETGPVTDTVTVPVIPVIGKNTITKVALISSAKRGEKVPYVITVTDSPFNPARIVDVMPPGFAFIEGSAVANGAKVEPTIDGRRLTFDGLVPDAGGDIKLELTLVATASVNPGSAVNQAQLVDPKTGKVVATAKAKVTILAEAIFDCGDIIGKVFDDQNRSGYQDEGEPGLPAVRVATVNGLLITTDSNGRFNIPCADLPDASIGSNFVVKLDTRSLPTGYHLTTENPRRVRLTAGKVVKLNFGASISRLVKLELNGKVFAPGSSDLNPKWQAGLDKLVAALEVETSVLQITYRGKDDALARARIHAVKDAVTQRWSAVPDHYELAIDSRIISGGAP